MAIKDRHEEKKICENIIRVLDKPHRLIDADKLKADFIGNRYGVQAIEYVIDQQPTVDAVPVRHGHWIFNPKDAIEMMFTLPKCSECGAESSNGGNYCPNCGARMDGVKSEN